MPAKSSYFYSSASALFFSVLLYSNRVLELLLWIPGLHKGSHVCSWPPKSVFSMCSQTTAKWGQNHFIVSCRFHSQYPNLPACYPVHQWVRLLSGPLVCDSGSHNSHRGTTYCWIDAEFLLLGQGVKWGSSYDSIMLTSLSPVISWLKFVF